MKNYSGKFIAFVGFYALEGSLFIDLSRLIRSTIYSAQELEKQSAAGGNH